MKYSLSALVSAGAAWLGAAALLLPSLHASSSAAAVRLRVELDRPVLVADRPEKAIVKVALDGTRLAHVEKRAPINLTLVLDRSGSMSGDKIENAKAAAIEAVRRLAADDIFSLVIFDHEVDTLIPATRVGDCRTAEARIRSIYPRGNTAIYAGVSQGVAELRKNLEDRRYTHRVLLLSDGLANKGPSAPDDFARLGQSLLRDRISVSTIGLGLDYNEDLMTRLAGKSDGNTYFVASSRDLPSIFNAELGDVLSVVARRVIVTIDFPSGVRPLSFVGREGSIRGQTAVFELNQLYGGQEKYALVEVEVASSSAGVEREVAKANVVFEDATTQRSVTVAAQGSVRFTAVEADVIAAANRQVQTDYAVNVTALAKDQAVSLVDANRRDAAARELRERNLQLEVMAKTYSNSAVMKVTVENKKEADRLERDGLDNAQRKTYRAESSQMRSQQSSSSLAYERP